MHDPLIFAGCDVKRLKEKLANITGKTVPYNALPLEVTEQKGDLLICDLWHNVTDSIHNMRVVNTYSKSYSAKPTEKCLQEAERTKKKYTWMHAPSSADTYPPLLLSLMNCLVWRRLLT